MEQVCTRQLKIHFCCSVERFGKLFVVVMVIIPCSACGDIAEFVSVMSHAAQTAVLCNALGALVCDWSLPGHVNPLTVSIPALLAGAGLAWKANTDVVSTVSQISHRHKRTQPISGQ